MSIEREREVSQSAIDSSENNPTINQKSESQHKRFIESELYFTIVISTNALRMRDGHQKGASHPRGPKSMAIVSAKSSSADSTVEFEEANVNIYR